MLRPYKDREGILRSMLSRLRHTLILALFVLLPFHALFVTVGTKLIAGPGYAPLAALAIWKEILIAALFVIGTLELWFIERKTILQILRGDAHWAWGIGREQGAILLLLLLSLALLPGGTDLTTYVYGFKYVFVPLIFFLLLRCLTWEENFLERKIFPALLVVGGIISLYGILSFFLPSSFFSALGYSDAHSLYIPGGPLSAFQKISGTAIRRVQSTFAGPNQLGLWLLVPWSIALSAVRLDRRRIMALLVLLAVALFLTFSRSAWIAAFIIALVACVRHMRGSLRVATLSSLVGVTLLGVIFLTASYPSLLSRSISNKHHLERTREGITEMFRISLGHGLGTAGPASNKLSDPCVYFEEGADISWAAGRQDLCLFVGGVQMQPVDRVCNCPVLPENWYVQIGYELGLLGFLFFLGLTLYLLHALRDRRSLSVFLMFLGVSLAALFLHAWEDAAVAYTVWGLTGIALTAGKK